VLVDHDARSKEVDSAEAGRGISFSYACSFERQESSKKGSSDTREITGRYLPVFAWTLLGHFFRSDVRFLVRNCADGAGYCSQVIPSVNGQKLWNTATI
jgi:hypothetical protein